jgi:hypothetical protein
VSSIGRVYRPGHAIRARLNIRIVRARATLDEIEKNWKPDGVSSFWIAIVHATLRENDPAFEWLERAFQERAGFMVFLKVIGQFQSLHGDRRFEALVKRVGVPN